MSLATAGTLMIFESVPSDPLSDSIPRDEARGDIRPSTSMVEVRALIDPAMLVEIEAEAVIASGE